MRLREYEKTLEQIELLAVGISPFQSGLVEVSFSNAAKTLVIELGELPPLANESRNIISKFSHIFNIETTKIPATPSTGNEFNTAINAFYTKAAMLQILVKSVLPTEVENSVAIKLPDLNDFDGLSNVIKNLNTIFQALVLDFFPDDSVTILSLDSGSKWIEFCVKTYVAYGLVASIVWSAAVIYQKKIEIDQKLEGLKNLKIKNESLQDFQSALKKELEEFINSEATAIETPFEGKPERHERITHSLKLLSELMQNGAEVYPGLFAPVEVKELFPDMKNIGLLESKQKLLTDPSKGSP